MFENNVIKATAKIIPGIAYPDIEKFVKSSLGKGSKKKKNKSKRRKNKTKRRKRSRKNKTKKKKNHSRGALRERFFRMISGNRF